MMYDAYNATTAFCATLEFLLMTVKQRLDLSTFLNSEGVVVSIHSTSAYDKFPHVFGDIVPLAAAVVLILSEKESFRPFPLPEYTVDRYDKPPRSTG